MSKRWPLGLVLALALLLVAGVVVYQHTSEPKKLPDCQVQHGEKLPTNCHPVVVNPNSKPGTKIEPTRPPSLDDKRPNVVLMLVDDMRVADLPYMPKLRKYLTDKGVYFPNMIAANPLCCPARSSLITAQYTHNNGVLTNKGPYGGLDALKTPNDTLPVWLQEAGYNTAFFGKYLNGYSDARTEAIPAGWDWWDATGRGTYAYTRFQFANNGRAEDFQDDYITTRLRQRSDAKLEQFAAQRDKTGQPFFIFDSYVAPHGAIGADKALVKELGPGPIPEEKYRAVLETEQNPSFLKPSYNLPTKNYPVKGVMRGEQVREKADMQHHFLLRIQALQSVDDAVARTVKTLKETGQYDNTVIMFLSDNGYLLGEHQKYGKQVAQAESVRVPLIISGPGFRGGQVSQRWATTADTAATVLALSQAKPHYTTDGKSLVGASSKDAAPTTGLLIENGNSEAKSTADPLFHYQGLLMGLHYTYAKWESSGGGEELYDNYRDPYQLVNVAKNPRYRWVLEAAREQLTQVKDCSGVGTCETKRDYWPNPVGLSPVR